MIDLIEITKPATFTYNSATGKTTCTIKYKNINVIGEAQCHPDDNDMQSERVGCYIAEMRAAIKYLQHIKNNELRPKLEALQHLESVYTVSPHCDNDSYELKILRRHIRLTLRELATAQNEIAMVKQNLKEYINLKDNLYKKIRKDKTH